MDKRLYRAIFALAVLMLAAAIATGVAAAVKHIEALVYVTIALTASGIVTNAINIAVFNLKSGGEKTDKKQ